MVVQGVLIASGQAANSTLATITPPLATVYIVTVHAWVGSALDNGILQLFFGATLQVTLAIAGGYGDYTQSQNWVTDGPYFITADGASVLTVKNSTGNAGAMILNLIAKSATAE